jgi:hypothetical protein
VSAIKFGGACVVAFCLALWLSWKYYPPSAGNVESERSRRSAAPVHSDTSAASDEQLKFAISALAAARGGTNDGRIRIADLPFINQLFLSDGRAAVSLKNGIRRALRYAMHDIKGCVSAQVDHDLPAEIRYWVESKGDRLSISRFSVKGEGANPAPPEFESCLAGLGSRTYIITTKQLLSPEMQLKYDSNHFFVEANFEDSETILLRVFPDGGSTVRL